MEWNTKKKDFEKTHNELSHYFQNGFKTDKAAFLLSLTTFIEKGGVYPSLSDSRGKVDEITSQFKKISGKLSGFENLNKNIMQYIRTVAETYDSGKMFQENNQLQKEIDALEKKKALTLNNKRLSSTRNITFKTRDSNVVSHQLFLFKSPIPKSYIPYIWGISFIFLASGIFSLKQSFPFPTPK